MHTCPVCGYDQLHYPPQDETICPSCYTEFGYDDATRSHEELRDEWLAHGAPWEGANVVPPPEGWNPYEQLKNLEPRLAAAATATTSGLIRWEGQIINDLRQARFFSGRVKYFNNLHDLILSQAAHG